jgi:DNA primase catalytic subunit
MTFSEITLPRSQYLSSLESIRVQSAKILESYLKGKFVEEQVFDLDMDKLTDVRDDIIRLIERDYSATLDLEEIQAKVPPHGRWRHFTKNHGRG